ncbi:MAG: hypothetical protein IIU58_07095 [Clostridia bacterium]|nr:hypothetical protein [Clostridia bacterium]
MTSNAIKLIACISMLIDHAGVILFPQVQVLRWIGRLAMPLFAFSVAEGALHTSNRKRYFLRMFLLGVGCQLVYAAEQILDGGLRSVYLNILFTFSFSMLLCFAYLELEKALQSGKTKEMLKGALLFGGAVAAALLFEIFCMVSKRLIGVSVWIDYGASGILLPLFALSRKRHPQRILVYAIGLVLFCLYRCENMPYIWVALLDIPILYFYNGERGKRSAKYGFYLFYPLHLAVLYGISMLL